MSRAGPRARLAAEGGSAGSAAPGRAERCDVCTRQIRIREREGGGEGGGVNEV